MTESSARRRSRFTDPLIDEYAAAHSTPPSTAAIADHRGEDRAASAMQIGDDQSLLMEMAVRAMGAKRAIEIGTFTGYSALAVPRGLGADGCLLCCDVSEAWTSMARDAWERSGVAERIELQIGPGLDTLQALPPGDQFDFAFIDADKPSYAQYYEEVLTRLRPGGLVRLDNMLQGGRVVDDTASNESVTAIRQLNNAIRVDERVKSYCP